MHTGEAHLQTLSLDRTASFEEVREAYQDLVMVWHPDRFMHHPRLYKKAEEKLKQVNQAYAYLKAQILDSGPAKTQPESSPQVSKPSPPRSTTTRSQTKPSTRRRRGIACPWLTFADAEYILNHYHFQTVVTREAGQQTYHSGPFVLETRDHPTVVTLSVPCDSLQTFDRILLSIPCKSKGRFCQDEAEQLLQLLQVQSA